MQKEAMQDTSFFNVMFFVKHGRVRSIGLSRRVFSVVGGCAICLCLWSVVSVVYIYALSHELVRVEDDLLYSRKVIFEYQSQYDGVYESVYPHLHSTVGQMVPFPDLDAVSESEQDPQTRDHDRGVSEDATAVPTQRR